MPIRPGHRFCLHCHAVLTDDEREHYVYACHPCAEAEHDASGTEPDGPGSEWIARSPVLIEIGPRRSRRAA